MVKQEKLSERLVGPDESDRPAISQLIARASRLNKTLFELAIASTGVSGPQWALLSQIKKTPGVTGNVLAKLMWVTPQAVQLVLSQLETKGLIVREQHGRALCAEVSAAGEAALAACAPAVERFHAWTLAAFDETQRQQLTDLLQTYVDSAEAEHRALLVSSQTGA